MKGVSRPGLLAFAAAALLLFPDSGCGGGGGSHPATVLPAACSDTAYEPNYTQGDGSGMTLRRWKDFPVHVFFDRTSDAYTDALTDRFTAGMDSWNTAVGGNRVTYVVESSASSADIVVRFVSTSDTILTSRNAVGVTFTQDANSSTDGREQLAAADVYIGIDGNTTRENGTMAHEFGHALGIGGHSPNMVDLMYKAGVPVRSHTPTTDDVDTLTTAYCNDFTSSASAETAPMRHVPIPADQRSGSWIAIP